METTNTSPARIWIELDKPPKGTSEDERITFMKKQCELANKFLAKVRAPKNEVERAVWDRFFVGYHRDHAVYCYGGNAGYKRLADNGEWFNLDYLAQ